MRIYRHTATLLLTAIALLSVHTVVADEGMWLIHNQLSSVYGSMRREGLRIGVDKIYNQSAPALADAVVAINGGMGTGSVISDRGLVITNHHVAYDDIHSLSTMEHNYLEEGFVALSTDDELPVNTSVTFLVRVEDVTELANSLIDKMKADGKWGPMSGRKLAAVIEERYAKTTDCEVSLSSVWRGEKYYLYYYRTYRDVRLVAAPSVHIGAFGGETDNWGWPQHKCDFALYRVYCAPDGSAAPYSKANVPLTPPKVLEVSTKGIDKGDFTMVIGYPGRTNRTVSSFAVGEKRVIRNPIVYKARRARLDIIKRNMEADKRVRLLYSDTYFNLSNYADYARWENICLDRYDVQGRFEEREAEQLNSLAPAERAEFARLIEGLKRGYGARAESAANRICYQEMLFGVSEVFTAAGRVVACWNRLQREGRQGVVPDDPVLRGVMSALGNFERIDPKTDRDLFVGLFAMFVSSVPPELLGDYCCNRLKEFDSVEQMARWSYDNSAFRSAETIREFFAQPKSIEQMITDPMIALSNSIRYIPFAEAIDRAERGARANVDELEAEYQKSLYRYNNAAGKLQYPNANSTMRLSYGRARSVEPSDAIHYDFRSSTEGYFDKRSRNDYDFLVGDRFGRLIGEGDWGRWGEKGKMYVDFVTDNDITGGNSGSPVLDGRGRLIGLAFDGNRESMAGDVMFNPDKGRTVSVDIRFVMWTLERVMGGEKIVNEICFAK